MHRDILPASTDGQTQDPLPQPRSAAAAPLSAVHGGPINILIVDDEPKNLTVLETVLNDPGYRLVRAESADQALLALVDEEFALLILDIQMPGMTGFELAQMIKERKKTAQVPIIFLTAYYNEDQHMLEGYGTGAVDYLHKPVNPVILRAKVAVFAELHRKNRALLAEVTGRYRAEEQLRELNETLEQRVNDRTAALVKTTAAMNKTDERYRSIFDGSLDAIFSLGTDERFEVANPAALKLTARTLEELKTIRFLDLCAPDQREAVEKAFRAVFGHQSRTLDTTVITATGERRNLFISAAPATVDGEVSGISCIARDITERKQAQEAVQQSEARLGGIISSAMDAIITIDQTQCVIDFNNAAEQMFGWAAADAVGQPIDRFIPARAWAMQGAHIEMSDLTHGTTHQIGALGMMYGHRANGEKFPIDASISHLQSPAGNLYTVILRDVTERIRQEEALRESEARYRDLIQALPAAVYTCDERGRVTLYNQAAIALWGREPEVGKDLWCGSWRIYRPDGAPLPLDECPMAVTLREGRAIRGKEIVIERPDGTRRYVLPHPEPMLNAAGVVVGAINMLIDITDSKQAEQAVAKLAAIITSSDDAIIGKDLRGIVTSWNRAAERLFGYTEKEMIGQPVTRLIPPERHEEESHILEKIMRGEPIDHYETIRRRKDGTELTVSLTVSPVVDLQGRIVGASKIARNITEQKRVEEALRRSEQELSDFFENASVGLHWVGPDGIIMRVNQTELDLLGYSREEYVGRHIVEFHVDQTVIQDILDRLACGETLREYPARIRCKDGSILDVLINSNVLFEDGKFIHTRCFTRDVTDRKRAEEALQKNEERFRMLADNISQFAWTADPTGWVFWYNQRWYEYTGTTFEEMQGWGWEKVHHPDHLERVVTKWRQAHASGEPWEDTFPLRGLDGTYRWFLSRALPIRDAEGRIVRWFGSNTDITELREAQTSLRENEERYRILFEAAPMALFVCDRNAVIQQYNRRAVEIWGREPRCGVERHCGSMKLWLPDHTLLPHAHSPMMDVLRTGIPAANIEVSIERPDGSRVPVLVNFSALKNAQGDITGVITSLISIIDRKQAEDALRERDCALTEANSDLKKQKAALAESNKELEGFSYSVSHDLRAPLRTIDAFSRIVEEDHGPHLNAEAHRCLTIIRKAAAQAGELIDDLLEFSRIGRQGMNFNLVKMANLAREVADDLKFNQEGRQIDLTIGDLPSCQGDRRFLKLVWTNLLTNAFKYTKSRNECRIEVGWMPDDVSADAVTYYVKDNGVGFDMKYAHKLFNVFQRLHGKEEFEGTGVGLAIVHRIVLRHEGRVWAEGKVDGGATFFFSLRKAGA